MGEITFNKGPHCLQSIRQRFVREFEGRYPILSSSLPGRDFVVKKDVFSGVYIGVEEDEERDTITVYFNKDAPHHLLRGPLARLLGDVQVLREVESLLCRIQKDDGSAPLDQVADPVR